MKQVFWSIVLLFFCSTMYAQDISQKISMNLQNVTLKEFFNKIETQTSLSVVYRDIILSENPDIAVSVTDRPLKDVLNQVLEKHGLSYKVSNKTIVIVKAPAKTNSKRSGKRYDERNNHRHRWKLFPYYRFRRVFADILYRLPSRRSKSIRSQ